MILKLFFLLSFDTPSSFFITLKRKFLFSAIVTFLSISPGQSTGNLKFETDDSAKKQVAELRRDNHCIEFFSFEINRTYKNYDEINQIWIYDAAKETAHKQLQSVFEIIQQHNQMLLNLAQQNDIFYNLFAYKLKNDKNCYGVLCGFKTKKETEILLNNVCKIFPKPNQIKIQRRQDVDYRLMDFVLHTYIKP